VSRRRPPRYDLPKAAPRKLRLAQVLVNTTDGHARELLSEWLEEQGVAASPSALARAREVREALRGLLIANNERTAPPAAAVAVLERAAARAHLSLRFAPAAEVVPSAGGADGALGLVLAAVLACMWDGSWSRLKACRNCHWAFYDESRNRSAAWCSMQLCGNRLKTRAYRQRRKALA
jgi:predicted RNA-binding Zn ribbon-like protein